MALETYSKPDLIYKLEDKPPFFDALVGALTHLLAIFVPMVLPAIIVGGALKLSPEATAYMVSMAMVASGVGTFLQVNRFGCVGSGLLSIQSVNFSFVTVMITAGLAMQKGGSSESVMVSTLLGVSFVGSFLVIGASRALPYLRKIITPTVSGIVVLMIGLSLVKIGIIDFGGGFAALESKTYGAPQNIGVATLVLVTVLLFNCSKNPLLRMAAIAIGLIVGYVVALALGMVSFDALKNAPIFTLPQPFKFGFQFEWHAFVAAALIYLLSVLEAVGDITATSLVSDQPIEGDGFTSRLSGGVLADGLVSAIACAFGSLPLTTFAQNNGVIQMTGVASRHVGRYIAVILVVLGLFPIIGFAFTMIPSPVIGGAMTLMFAMIAIAGIRMIMLNSLDRREAVIVATSIGLGLGVAFMPDLFKPVLVWAEEQLRIWNVPEVIAQLPSLVNNLVDNPICVGGVTGILLNTIIPQIQRDKEAADKRNAAPIKVIYPEGPEGLANSSKED